MDHIVNRETNDDDHSNGFSNAELPTLEDYDRQHSYDDDTYTKYWDECLNKILSYYEQNQKHKDHC